MGSFSLTNKDRVLSEAWETCCEAYECRDSFLVKYPQRHDFVFIAFPGCNDLRDMAAEDEFGECKIDKGNPYFTSFKSTATEEPAIVYEPALKRLLFLLENTGLKNKIKEEKERGRWILFTGHSVGGAVAAMATAWLLEMETQTNNVGSFPYCITFGSPLFGDCNFGQAIRRERWTAQFYHVIARYDVVPRILLAPFISISEALEALLPYWRRSLSNSGGGCVSPHSQFRLLDQSVKLVRCVMQHASAAASYRSAMCMAPNNMLLGGISSVVRQSPYRPFGFYVFLSERGVIRTENYEAVLQILFYWLQSSDPHLQTPEACISDHISYGSRLQDLQNLMDIDADSRYDDMNVATQMETLGLEMQNTEVRLALLAAGEAMERLRSNSAKKAAEWAHMAAAMEDLEAYRKHSKAMGVGYYDSFKLHEEKRAFEANLARLRLAGFWDEVKDMVERRELPDEFASEEEWIKAGTLYRMLVEPLDIANYYRLGKHEDTGHYLVKGRPRRYMEVEKWLRLSRRAQTGGGDSTLWAHFEELSYTMTMTGGDGGGNELSAEMKARLEKFEQRVKTAIDSNQLCEDFLLEQSSFVKWWKRLPPPLKWRSPLFAFMEGEGRRKYRAVNVLSPDFSAI